MIQALALGSMLGLTSGVVPGPFSALVAASALGGGFRAGVRIAVVPLLSETVALVLCVLALSQLPEQALRWMGVAGGVLVFYVARRLWADAASDRPEPGKPGQHAMAQGVALAVLSPAPWVFWLLIGGPLFLASWHEGAWEGVMFLGAFLVCLVGVHLALAGLAGYGHRRLPMEWRRRLMRGTAAVLVVAGCVLVWQSWIGNFERMVSGSDRITDFVEDGN